MVGNVVGRRSVVVDLAYPQQIAIGSRMDLDGADAMPRCQLHPVAGKPKRAMVETFAVVIGKQIAACVERQGVTDAVSPDVGHYCIAVCIVAINCQLTTNRVGVPTAFTDPCPTQSAQRLLETLTGPVQENSSCSISASEDISDRADG